MSKDETINLIKDVESKINNIDLLETIKHIEKSEFITNHVLSLDKDNKDEYVFGIGDYTLDMLNDRINGEGIYLSFLYAQEAGYVFELYEDEPEEYPQFAKYKDDENYESLKNYDVQCGGEYYDIIAPDDMSIYETSEFGITLKRVDDNLKVSFKFHEGAYSLSYGDLDPSLQISQEVIKIIAENIIYKE